MELQQIHNLLRSVQIVVKNERIEKRLKGENFNIFSILNLETKENGTHSAFLGELLNPKGSHLMGNKFLILFLDVIEDNTLDINTTRVMLEKDIGPVVINREEPLESTGGRIDIYLEDHKGNAISIENKINAPEQELQVVRYWNYKEGKNQVYYLTSSGETPSAASTSTLKPDVDFKEITYGDHILKWLAKCQKEAFDNPILRESIKQYSNLLKKITGKMDDRHKEELHNLILSNFEAAETIAANAREARKTLCAEIQKLVLDDLKKEFQDLSGIIVEQGNDISHKNAQIWIRRDDQKSENRLLQFTLESFSGEGHFGGNLFIGILNPPPHDSKFANLPNKLSISRWVINAKEIPAYEGFAINLNDKRTIQKLYTDKKFKAEFVKHIVRETREYFYAQYPNLERFWETKELPQEIE
ncbi:MAG: PD-(D/E)XK nuclease family protein [Lewinellaceae bacterium]|nr:PD-(D/E)XK nuclease family protein [Lewinellaceae bacterium]